MITTLAACNIEIKILCLIYMYSGSEMVPNT